ncbi:hypothetical protein D3C72_2039540 [compost metagenome]
MRLTHAFLYHFTHEGFFAAFAPQLVIFAAKVLYRLIRHLTLAQLMQFAAGTRLCFLL